MISAGDLMFMSLAKDVSVNSKDRSRKVGAVVVGPDLEVRASGFNAFPRGVKDLEERHQRPAKYFWTEHAERNAIYKAARCGTALDGCTMYVPWFPCVDCARAIVQSGISRLVAIPPDLKDTVWGPHFVIAIEMLKEANVEVSYVSTGEHLAE